MNYVHEFFFQIYPYIVFSIFFLGSLIRFDREQYSWKSDSSELLKRGNLRLGSNFFHIGVLFVLAGHVVGLLIPETWFEAIGISARLHQIVALTSGGAFGAICLIGIAILIHRRLTEPRIRATTRIMDAVVLGWLFVLVGFGMGTIYFTSQHLNGELIALLAQWAQHIITFRGGAAAYAAAAPLEFQIHLLLGLTLFALVPFSRLAHIWSGVTSVGYLLRPYQLVRPKTPRRASRQAELS